MEDRSGGLLVIPIQIDHRVPDMLVTYHYLINAYKMLDETQFSGCGLHLKVFYQTRKKVIELRPVRSTKNHRTW